MGPETPLALAILVHGSAAVPAAEPILVTLPPLSEPLLHGCEASDLEAVLSSGLRNGKRFRYAPELEEGPVTLEITACSQLQQEKRTSTSRGGPVVGPVGGGGGMGFGADKEFGVQKKVVPFVVLRARLIAGPRSLEVANGQKDHTLREAAAMLRRNIDKALTERGEWLVPPSP